MLLRKISRLALLTALCIVLRYAFSGLPNVQPITAIFLVVSVCFSLPEGIMLTTLTMFVSSFLLGFGPWVLWQIGSFSLVLTIWFYVLYPLTNYLKPVKIIGVSLDRLGYQAIFAAILGIVYGMVIDTWSAILFGTKIWLYVLSGMPYNIAHSLSTLFFYPLIHSIFRRFYSNEKDL